MWSRSNSQTPTEYVEGKKGNCESRKSEEASLGLCLSVSFPYLPSFELLSSVWLDLTHLICFKLRSCQKRYTASNQFNLLSDFFSISFSLFLSLPSLFGWVNHTAPFKFQDSCLTPQDLRAAPKPKSQNFPLFLYKTETYDDKTYASGETSLIHHSPSDLSMSRIEAVS